MPEIELETVIFAPRERVFDLARSIDAHRYSTEGTSEKAVAGVTSGLIRLGQEVTWEARHFGIRQRLTVKITQCNPPHHFQDVMTKGAFASMMHDHTFEDDEGHTRMVDRFAFTAPFGPLGRIVEHLVLVRYMTKFLRERNETLKRLAESEDWKQFLPNSG